MYIVVLISAIQKSDSVTHIFFTIMVYHSILNIVPCAIQEDLFYLLCENIYIYT